MTKTRIVYKVTSSRMHNARLSINENFEPTQYDINLTTTPTYKGSKLFCFETLEAAQRFVQWDDRIFKARATNVVKPKNGPSWHSTMDEKRAFWKLRTAKKSTKMFTAPFPTGTLFADSITLLEEIIL